MLTDKFIALLKAILLLGILLIILLFNTDLSESSQVIEQKLIDDTAVAEEFERLQRNKTIMDATQKYRQQVLEQEQKEYQHFNSQGQKYIKTLTIQQRKEQQQLNRLKQRRSQAELELKKIRREREELSNANYSTN